MIVHVKMESKRYDCEFILREKITVVIGDSAVGKTEFTRRLSGRGNNRKLIVSNGFRLFVLTKDVFEIYCENALQGRDTSKDRASDPDAVERSVRKHLKEYWNADGNFPINNRVIIVDDEDFITSRRFAVFVRASKTNCFLLISRARLSALSYSIDEIYKFVTDGKNHWLEQYYHFHKNTDVCSNRFDMVMVEGTGSDYIFFKEMFLKNKVLNPVMLGSLQGGGKASVVKVFETDADFFRNKRVLIMIDYCAFGSEIEALFLQCAMSWTKIFISREYLSFEYLLLKSNLIDDQELEEYTRKHRLEFMSLEELFLSRLCEITDQTYYKYSKAADEFSVCYYKECCMNRSNNRNSCEMRVKYCGKNKFAELLKNTKFEFLLKAADRIE